MTRFFPAWDVKNVRIFYLLNFTQNAWWIAGNWIFFWTRYMTYGTLGIVDALAFGFGLLMEIPTGAIADLLGKKRTIVTAMGLMTIGAILMTHTGNQYPMFAGFLLAQLGWALFSGAAEALAYDSLVDKGREQEFENVISTATATGIVFMVLTTLFGGLLYYINFRLPHIFWWLSYAVGFVISLFATEPKTDTLQFTWKNYFGQLATGFKQLISPALRSFFVFNFALFGAFVIYDFGLVRPALAVSFGFDANAQAVILAVFGLVGALFARSLPQIRKRVSDATGLYLLSLVMGLAYVSVYFGLGVFGIFTLAAIDLSGRIVYPWLSVIINKSVDSKYRATTISTSSLLSRFPYVFVAIFAGIAAETGQLRLFGLVIGIVVLGLTALNYLVFGVLKGKSK